MAKTKMIKLRTVGDTMSIIVVLSVRGGRGQNVRGFSFVSGAANAYPKPQFQAHGYENKGFSGFGKANGITADG